MTLTGLTTPGEPAQVRYPHAVQPNHSDSHLVGKTTEEGWAIFKEDELGINPEAGGQCPFLAPLHALGTLI